MNPPRLTRRQQAVTLTELLVALAVIAVLAALLFPVLRGMGERASAVNCVANLRAFGSAVLLYRNDHNGFLPPGRLLSPTFLSENNNPTSGVNIKQDLIGEGYLQANALPYCPAMRLSETGIKNLKRGETAQSIFKRDGSYVLNLFLLQTKIESLPGPYFGSYAYPGNSRMLLAAESYFTGVTNSLAHQNITLKGMDYGTSYNHAPRSHGKNQLNFMFLDGHIATLAPRPERKANGDYDWENVFDSGGRDGKYISQRTAYAP